MLMAHYDVVPVEEDQWEREPFAAELVDGVLWGRGTLDTKGIIDVFPPEQQEQIRIQLADVLECVIGKSLLPKIGGGRVAAYEILVATPAIRSLIRQNKSFQIPGTMQTARRQGMQLLDDALADLVRQHVITLDSALEAANDPAQLGSQFGRL